MKKTMLLMVMALMSAMTIYAEETSTNDINSDSSIIKLDADMVPINYVNQTLEDLIAGVGELETILETDNFQLYQAGDFTFKIVDGIVVTQSIQFEDANDDKILYNKILSELAKSNFIKDSHNTGGNYYQYADFQIQFDDFQGYEKLTYSVIPAE